MIDNSVPAGGDPGAVPLLGGQLFQVIAESEDPEVVAIVIVVRQRNFDNEVPRAVSRGPAAFDEVPAPKTLQRMNLGSVRH